MNQFLLGQGFSIGQVSLSHNGSLLGSADIELNNDRSRNNAAGPQATSRIRSTNAPAKVVVGGPSTW
jgi:hypothetical protein